MNKEELINYWKDTAEHDYKTMEHLFASGDYVWCLFVGHLVIEKLLKACYVKYIDSNVPLIHDLSRLADLSKLNATEKQKDRLDIITAFNLRARYPDYKMKLYKLANRNYTEKHVAIIKELRQWLLLQI